MVHKQLLVEDMVESELFLNPEAAIVSRFNGNKDQVAFNCQHLFVLSLVGCFIHEESRLIVTLNDLVYLSFTFL